MTNTGKRPIVGVRMSEHGIKNLDALATGKAKRSDVVRVLLSEAMKHPGVMREVRRRLDELSE